MEQLFTLMGAATHQPAVDEWLSGEPDALFSLARHWFAEIRRCGDDVQELLHDGCPVACVHGAAFAYVNVFAAHVNVGFFAGAALDDPAHLLEGTGKRMRHVKLRPGREPDARALTALIRQAYAQIRTAVGAD